MNDLLGGKPSENKKSTNPKDALGIKKVPFHCVPCGPLMEIGLAMMEGGRKYGTHNYRDMGTRASVYYNAAIRHLMDWWEGEDIDPDSGIHHVMKVAACMVVIRDSMLMGNWDDDRPIKYPAGLNISQFNNQAADMVEKYPDCIDPFLEKDKPYSVPTIECVPSKGWQIRLANGMFLMAYQDHCRPSGMNFQEINSPHYYETKAIAQDWVNSYLKENKS